MEESFSNKKANAKTKEESAAILAKEPQVMDKINRIKECAKYLIYNKVYVNETTWSVRFDLPLPLYLEQVADTNMRIFMNMATDEDKQVS